MKYMEIEPISVIERLKQIDPKRNVAYVAADHLTDPLDMIRFMNEYAALTAEYLASKGMKIDPFEAAATDMGYVTNHMGGETARRWSEVFEGLPHPYFGNSLSSLPGDLK